MNEDKALLLGVSISRNTDSFGSGRHHSQRQATGQFFEKVPCQIWMIIFLVLFMSSLLSLGHVILTKQQQIAIRTSIKSGEIWVDTNFEPINAHGGGFLYHNGLYWWHGEMKEGKTQKIKKKKGGFRFKINFTGIGCYSSSDLLNWNNHGNVLPAVHDDPDHDLYSKGGIVAERPKVVYNAKTKKFVMWLHVDTEHYQAAKTGVAISDKPDGPFEYLYSFRPNANTWPIDATNNNMTDEQRRDEMPIVYNDYENGQMSRDLTIFVDDDSKAYLFSTSEGNPTMHISELTDDYLNTTGKYKRVFVGRSMEAPTVFKRDDKYYFIGSGCTGWKPNKARMAVSDGSIWGPWYEKGNPCIGPKAGTTFTSQSTYVLPVHGLDGNRHYIFMADRWKQKDLADSRYVWLPISFNEEGLPTLQWLDEWVPPIIGNKDMYV